MTEEQLTRIEITLDGLVEGHRGLRADVAEVRVGYEALRSDVAELRAGQDSMRADIGDLKRHMGVLHEEIIDRIKALELPVEKIQRQIRAGDAAVRTELGARLDIVEAALRVRRRQKRSR